MPAARALAAFRLLIYIALRYISGASPISSGFGRILEILTKQILAVHPMARTGSANSMLHLGDFSTDRRVLILVAMAVLVGAGGALSAWFLLRIIALTTN